MSFGIATYSSPTSPSFICSSDISWFVSFPRYFIITFDFIFSNSTVIFLFSLMFSNLSITTIPSSFALISISFSFIFIFEILYPLYGTISIFFFESSPCFTISYASFPCPDIVPPSFITLVFTIYSFNL